MKQILLPMVVLIHLYLLPAYASFDLAPIIVSVSPSGSGATTSLTLTNSSDSKSPIQIAIYRRVPDLDGIEKYEDAKDSGDLFQVFPSQVILNPKEKRTVRVTYVGDPKIKQELSFRIIAEEFPINVSDPKKVMKKAVASIAVLTKYIGSLYVTPAGTAADLIFETSILKTKEGSKLVIIINNRGSQHHILKQSKFTLVTTNDGKEYPLPTESIAAIGSQNILAGMSRKFTIPWPKGVPLMPVKMSLDLAKK